jgi:cytochrome c biogenesis protein CcdA
VQQDLVGLAFAAGLVAALNPCGFAMLPAYLALVVRGSEEGGGAAVAVGRALAATAAMTLGFLAVFGTFGFFTVSLASTVQRYMPYVTVLIGIVLVALGSWLLSGRELTLPLPNQLSRSASWGPTSRLGSMFGYGIGYAIASLSCTIGPFLAVTGAGVGGTSVLSRVWIYLAYAAGFALVVGTLAVAVALAGSAVVERMRRILPYVNRIGGAVLILVGLYVGYYGFYEIRLFTAGGNPADPVIAAASRLQGAMAGWVHRHGAWPWVVLLAVLLLAALVWAWWANNAATSRRRRSRADRATAGDEP